MDPEPPSTVALTIGAAAWRRHLADPERVCREALTAALARVPRPPWLAQTEVSVLLADDATVRRPNAEYRGRHRATHVLAIPAFETVRAGAIAQRKPLAHHVSHLLAHGCLHLLGYDHENAEDALLMEGLERDILAQLGTPDPYGGDAEPPVAHAAGALSAETER